MQKIKFQNHRIQKEDADKWSWIRFFPLIAVFLILPFVSKIVVMDNPLQDYYWQSIASDSQWVDTFLYSKGQCLVIIAVIMAAIILYSMISGYLSCKKNHSSQCFTFKWPIWFVLLALIALLTLLSALTSPYRNISFHGIYEQFQTPLVLLAYLVLPVFALFALRTEQDIKIIIRFFIAGVVVMIFIGLLQMSGNDPFRWSFVQKMIRPSLEGSLEFKVDKTSVYMTLFNPNYVGAYTALVLPCVITWFVGRKRSSPAFLNIAAAVLMSVGLVLCVLGAEAKNGLIAVAAAMIVLLIFYRKTLFKGFLRTVLIFAGIIAILAGAEAVSAAIFTGSFTGGGLCSRVVRNIAGGFAPTTKNPALQDITTDMDHVTVKYNGELLILSYDILEDEDGAYIDMHFEDGQGNELAYEITPDTGEVKLKDNRFSSFSTVQCEMEDKLGFAITIDGFQWYFFNEPEKDGYYHLNSQYNLVKIRKAESALFTNYGHMFSGRGYIWSRTIPLLESKLFLGSGPDTFAIVFPQDDYVGMVNNGYEKSLITRPHSMYLQMGVQTGVLSLLCFLAFFGIYAVSSIRLYGRKRAKTFGEHMGVGILAGTSGYMISGLVNDSLVVTACFFWCLLGVGIAVNKIVITSRKKDHPSKQ